MQIAHRLGAARLQLTELPLLPSHCSMASAEAGEGEGIPCTPGGTAELGGAGHRARFVKELKKQMNRSAKFMLAQVAILSTRVEELHGTVRKATSAGQAATAISAELDLEPSGINTPKILPLPAPAIPDDGDSPAAAEAPAAPETAAGSAPSEGTVAAGAAGAAVQNKVAIKAVRNMIQQVADEVEDLKEFATLNLLAVSKASKKWDKKHSSRLAASTDGPTAAEGEAGEADVLECVTEPLRGALEALAEASALKTCAPILAQAEKECLAIMTEAGSLVKGGGHSAAARGRAARKVFADAASSGQADPGAVSGIPIVHRLKMSEYPVGVTKVRVAVGTNALSEPMTIPVIIIKGATPGPVLGITSALHGNELNGIPVIHRVMSVLDPSTMVGSLVAVPVANPGGFVRHQRGFSDGVDLNRIMPGKKNGNSAQTFAYKLLQRVVSVMDYLLDLHTASFGRVNSLYVRADMNVPLVRRLAQLQQPQIIVHNTGPDGSMRAAAADMGIHAVTLEIGNPQRFHSSFVDRAVAGVLRTLAYLNIASEADLQLRQAASSKGLASAGAKLTPSEPLTPGAALTPAQSASAADPVVCARSFWIFTRAGGVLFVLPSVNTWVHKGQVIAEVRSIFGELVDRHVAPMDGIVVGKSDNPVCRSGDRVLHLGVHDHQHFPGTVSDGH